MRKGFTLVEIVLGLILLAMFICGVNTGAELFHKAHINQMVGQLKEYEAATSLFRQKYNCIPGDCAVASTAVNDQTLNGNGDGKINFYEQEPSEPLILWQQLSEAKMISGNYTGKVSATKGIGDVDVNVPRVKGYSDAGVWIVYKNRRSFNIENGPGMFGQSDRHVIIEGGGGDPKTRIYNGFADTDMVEEIDRKLDDGKPGSGDLNATRGLNDTAGCTLPAGPSAYKGGLPGSYDLKNNQSNCAIFYWIDL